jgi:hypothetical protein
MVGFEVVQANVVNRSPNDPINTATSSGCHDLFPDILRFDEGHD